jgi:hypothetical protein
VILATQEVKIRRFEGPGQPRQKVSKTSSYPIDLMWWCKPVVPATREVLVEGALKSRLVWGKKSETSLKNKQK